jgi:dTDP-4-amino-4,6-dideoxygalactose transaminase
VKLRYLDEWSRKRRENALAYNSLFHTGKLESYIILPVIPVGYNHIFNQYVICVDARDSLREYLVKHDIGTEIYYPVPLHLQECFANLGYGKGDFPVSEKAAKTSLALPIYPELTFEMQYYIVDTIKNFFQS